MQKTYISSKQFGAIVYTYIMCNDIIRGLYNRGLSNDTWIPVVLGIFGSILIFLIYSFIYKNNDYSSFPEAIENILGKFISKIIFIIYPLYFIFLTFLNLRDIIELVILYLIDGLPIFICAAALLFVAYYTVNKGIEVQGRISLMFFFLFIFIFMLFGTLVYLVNVATPAFLLPILEHGIQPIVIPSLMMSYSIPFGELFVLFIFYQFVRDKKKNYKYGIYGILVSGAVLLLITLSNIILVGPEAMKLGLNPTLGIVKLIDYRNYIQRLDLVIIDIILLHVLSKSVLLITCSQQLINHILKIKKEYLISLTICILLTVSFMFFGKDYVKLIYFRTSFFMPYVNLVFEVAIPFLLVFISFFKKKKPKKEAQQQEQAA